MELANDGVLGVVEATLKSHFFDDHGEIPPHWEITLGSPWLTSYPTSSTPSLTILRAPGGGLSVQYYVEVLWLEAPREHRSLETLGNQDQGKCYVLLVEATVMDPCPLSLPGRYIFLFLTFSTVARPPSNYLHYLTPVCIMLKQDPKLELSFQGKLICDQRYSAG